MLKRSDKMLLDAVEKQAFVRRMAGENEDDPIGAKVYWSRHAIEELVKDGLERAAVENALKSCEVIEDYPEGHRPLPDCLVLGTLATGAPLHAVVAIDQAGDRIFMVTVYLPSAEDWNEDWRTRK